MKVLSIIILAIFCVGAVSAASFYIETDFEDTACTIPGYTKVYEVDVCRANLMGSGSSAYIKADSASSKLKMCTDSACTTCDSDSDYATTTCTDKKKGSIKTAAPKFYNGLEMTVYTSASACSYSVAKFPTLFAPFDACVTTGATSKTIYKNCVGTTINYRNYNTTHSCAAGSETGAAATYTEGCQSDELSKMTCCGAVPSSGISTVASFVTVLVALIAVIAIVA